MTTLNQFYTADDLEDHCTLPDCWVSLFGKVLNISALLLENSDSTLINPILKVSGSDISHWFDSKTHDLKTKIDVNMGKKVYVYPPEGRFLHAPNNFPVAFNEPFASTPWWKDSKYVIGTLTGKKRSIRIINSLTHQEQELLVPSEETIQQICSRYEVYNSHAKSYTFKDIFNNVLDMGKT